MSTIKRGVDDANYAYGCAYVGRYLAEFAYRLNRRVQPQDRVPRLTYLAVRPPFSGGRM